jgi:hypothetical protein
MQHFAIVLHLTTFYCALAHLIMGTPSNLITVGHVLRESVLGK